MTAPNDPVSPHTPHVEAAPPADQGAVETARDGGQAPENEAPAEAPRRLRRHMTPQLMAAEMARLDRWVVIVVLVLAFMLGSFIARNSDLWVRLATGRDIVQGTYRFHGDPFAYTLAGDPHSWIHPGWLADVAFYLISGAREGQVPGVGGMVLVGLKAFLVTATALVLLRIGRWGQSTWIPATCTALAVIVLSTRCNLHPICISFLFLSITVYLLVVPGLGRAALNAVGHSALRPFRWRWLLVPLFALWVNLDSWFLIGPITVALYLLGQALQQRLAPAPEDSPLPGELRELCIILALGLAACVLNPYHVRVFATLPPEVWPAVTDSPLLQDDLFRDLSLSPLGRYYSLTGGGRTVAGWSYIALLLVGIVSFAVNSDQIRWWRAALWLPFCLLGAWLVRGVPFFAIVAGPITALNFQDFAARRYGTEPRLDSPWRQWSLAGRALTLLAGVVLLLLAWPGWLHAGFGVPNSARRVGWGIEAEPNGLAAARAIGKFRNDGLLHNGFNFIMNVTDHCAWFCPDEKPFADLRTPAYPARVLEEFVAVRRELKADPETAGSAPLAGAAVPEDGSGPTWRDIFRRYAIDHVIVSWDDTDAQNTLFRMLADTSEWIWLYTNGQTSVFAWDDPERPGQNDATRVRQHRLDLGKLAFGPDVPDGARCPAEGMPPPVPPGPLARYLGHSATRPLGADEAKLYAKYYRVAGYVGPRAAAVASCFAAASGAILGAGVAAPVTTVASAWTELDGLRLPVIQAGQDPGPVGSAVMAVRAARRGISENSLSPSVYPELAEAYIALWRNQEQRWAGQGGQFLQVIRQTQIVTALQNALALEPEPGNTHLLLAETYLQMNAGSPQAFTHLDLCAEELRTGIRLLREAGPVAQTRESFEESIGEKEKRLDQVDQELQRRRDDYELKAAGRPRFARAQIAYEHGLAKEAYDRMLEGDTTDLSKPERTFILGLMLSMGQIRDAEAVLADVMGPREHLMVAAALGDYAKADKLLESILSQIDRASVGQLANLIRGQAFQSIVGPASLQDFNQIVRQRRDRDNWLTVRGVLALEAGDTALAARHLAAARHSTFPATALEGVLATAAAHTALEMLCLTAAAAPGWLPVYSFELAPVVPHYVGLLERHGTLPAPNPALADSSADSRAGGRMDGNR